MTIRNKKTIIIIFFLFTIQVYSQINGSATISGYIVDHSTQKPIEHVNVFISNSILGASTDQNGFYKITQVPAGNHDIVASMVGYKVATKPVLIYEDQKLNISFKLNQQIYELNPIEVVGQRPKKWLKDLKKFKEKLFGKSEFASQCQIENPEVLEFINDKNGCLIAKADIPLKIINNALGYEIHFILSSFIWIPKERKLRYIFQTHFKTIESNEKSQIQQWEENRTIAYNGSIRHFFISLITDSLKNSGLRVFHVSEIDPQKPLHIKNIITDPYNFLILPSLIPNEYKINFSDYLKIVYTREAVVSFDNFNQAVITKENPQVSWIKMKERNILVDPYGNSQGIMTFELYGYWSDFGVAEMLPKYFVSKK